ncbi:Planctomycete cytochrome C [Rubripirellula amarantea]|uniref:Planctomycete cytochrome C n=1 Tax=Rubripirellula amarantea TaxID=2527999 RepID=A0A5C5WYH4_9BACT|nr:PSD1 and planctomycete cytochrome C domain-containing protein [Rubripirellula amarantea]TWT54955.1 Planctomycete cytochrome C [Rubripirellula amarantea]
MFRFCSLFNALAATGVIGLLTVPSLLAEHPDDNLVDFRTQVQPILSDRCFHCHGPDAQNQDSAFRADSRENLFADLGGYFAVVPGNVDESEIHLRIHSDDEELLMPPPDSNRSLSKEEKATIDLWIQQGAPYQGHWAFEKPVKTDPPDVNGKWGSHPIDCFIAEKLASHGLTPSPSADPSTLLRRAALTLTGLLPPQELSQAYLADPSDEAYAEAIDELLSSDAYAERQTLRWLDAARYADTDGYQVDQERTNWPWRDWVVKAFRENMPFDQFTIEQIAGDMLPNAIESQQIATAFNRNHRQNNESGALAKEFFVENVIDRVETTSTVWLGLTFGCSRCHDHKYDPLTQREFYQMFAYFNNIGESGIGKGVNANPTLKTSSPLVDVPENLRAAMKEANRNLTIAEKDFNQRLSGLIESLETKVNEAIGLNEDAAPTLGLEADLVSALQVTAEKRTYQHKKVLREHFERLDEPLMDARRVARNAEQELKQIGAAPATIMVMREKSGEPTPAYLLARGQYDAPVMDTPLSRGVPTWLLANQDSKQPANRLELARWLVSPDNPITARVIVNRIWQDHFGIGLVSTANDFGIQGERPSHPELLDWLAVEFVESGWDIKAMHRLIVTSQTYRQSSKADPKQIANDPKNRLLSRGPRYRADGFTIRDLALQASGLLDETVGGPSVKPYQPKGLWETVAADAGTTYTPSGPEGLYRKSMYTYWKRAVNPPRQIIFDAGGREVCSVAANRTNTPLQALVLMNDPTFIESARKLAERVLSLAYSENNDTAKDDANVTQMYRIAVSQPCSDKTIDVLIKNLNYFRKHYAAKPDDAEKLLAVGQSVSNDALDRIELAAMTAVAHLILNTDEFMSIE